MTLTELQAARSVLEAARYSGVRTVEYGDGRRVTYASDSELASALSEVNRQIAAAQADQAGRPPRRRALLTYSVKGL